MTTAACIKVMTNPEHSAEETELTLNKTTSIGSATCPESKSPFFILSHSLNIVSVSETEEDTATTTQTSESTMRKRDRKCNEKQARFEGTATAAAMEMCKACNLYVEKTNKKTGLCHICMKTLNKAQTVADIYHGQVEYVEAARGLVVRCAQDHVWNVPFKVK